MNILLSFALLFFAPQTESPSAKVFLNGEAVDLKDGISLADFPSRKDELNWSFVFDKAANSDLTYKMELALVRASTAEMVRPFNNVRENQQVNVPGLLAMLKPGDDIVIDLSNSLDKKREFITIRVKK